MEENFSYYLDEDSNSEALFGLKQYFNEYINFDDPHRDSKFITSSIIGTLMFELLQHPDINYNEQTTSNINYFKYYLEKCIDNKDYCSNKVFLACITGCLHLSLPPKDFHIENRYTIDQTCDYNIIHSTAEKKTDIIYNNRNKLKYSKIYFCNCIEDLFICSMYELFEKGYVIRKCQNCNRFFVTKEKGKRRKYCYNTSPQDPRKTCYEYSSQLKSKNQRRTNKVIYYYNKINTRLNNRIDRTSDEAIIELCENKKRKLALRNEQMKEDVKSGKISKQDWIDFLIEYDKNDIENWKNEKASLQ